MLVGGVLKRPMEDKGLNTIGTFAPNRPGADALTADARRAPSDLGGLVQALLGPPGVDMPVPGVGIIHRPASGGPPPGHTWL